MKKIFIFASFAKLSLAVSLFPFHNSASLSNAPLARNSKLYQVLNASVVTTEKAKSANINCYTLNNLILSSAKFMPNFSNTLLTKKLPITKNINQCNDSDSVQQTDSTLPSSTKLALAVLDKDRKYKILITDYSGQHIQPIIISSAPITSLSWNKASNSIAYVSYEAGKPVVYIQNIYSSQRYVVANFNGSNSSPAFAGDSLLVSLSKDYGTHIYKIDLSKYTPKKTAAPLITTSSIDTEADYANGNIIFTSNKKNTPQIYLKRGSAQIQQISVNKNNITGRISNDGTKILYVHGNRGKYDLMYYDLDTNRTMKIDSGKILSGSFAPNNNLIAYIKNNGIIIYNLNNRNSAALPQLRYKETFDAKWSK
ncbi:MAG: hypothetical protein EKK54_10440 [Neisseriaceae bacterium]|nr:MAG: hypothetical protein EKK54_10440 [Neisseriaceae bacterium]